MEKIYQHGYNSAQVHIYDETSIIVIVDFGKWVDKAVVGTIVWFIFAPLTVSAVIGREQM